MQQAANDIRMDFIESNKDWNKFVGTISSNTGAIYKKQWIENVIANKEMIQEYGWAAPAFQESHKDKTVVLLGASPAIAKQIDQLRELQHEPDFVFIGITSGLAYLLKNGIRPKYVLIADADPAMVRFWEDMDMEQTKDITLLANVCTHPDMLKMWKGDIKFLAIFTVIKKLDKKIAKLLAPINGCGQFFPALCGQYNTAAAFAAIVLEAGILIFVGNELSFADPDVPYYVDRRDIKDTWIRKPHIDIYGKTVYTNYMFMSLKMALEDFLGKLPMWFFNATEAGIFGVSVRYGNLPWIYQLRLPMAVAQARSIMRTGQPLTEPKNRIVRVGG
jgi:hypothetical protein